MKAQEISVGEKLSEENLEKILVKTNQLLKASTQASLEEASSILEALASLKYEKYQLKSLEIKNFTEAFNQCQKLSSKDIAKFCKACSKLAYDKDELGLDIKKLISETNLQFGKFNLSEKITLLSSLAKLGFDENHGELNPLLLKISQNLEGKLANCHEGQIASYIHSLAKMELFDCLFEEKNGQKLAKEKITSALTFDKIANLSSDAAFSLLQAQMICHLTAGIKFFDQEAQTAIAGKYFFEEAEVSNLQKLVAKTLKQKGFKVESEYSIYEIEQKSLRDLDIKASKDIAGTTQEYYIEIDGPTHFFAEGEVDSATRKRNRLNNAAIRESDKTGIGKCYYSTISFAEIDKNRSDLSRFLDRQLAQASEIILKDNAAYQLQSLDLRGDSASAKKADEELRQPEVTKNIETVAPAAAKNKKKKKSGKASSTSSSGDASSDLQQMQQAISEANLAALEELLKKGLEVNANLPNGLSPASHAVQSTYEEEWGCYSHDEKRIAVLNSLIGAGANFEGISPIAKSELLPAIFIHSLNYEALFCAAAQLDFISLKPSAITEALDSRSLNIVEAVVSKPGFNPNSREAIKAINSAAQAVASDNCDIKILGLLLSAGGSAKSIELGEEHADLAKNLLTQSLLHCPEIFSTLLNSEKISSKVSGNGWGGILFQAAMLGNQAAVEDLLVKRQFTDQAKSIAFRHACQEGHENLVNFFLEKGADANVIFGNSLTPLTIAAQNGHVEVVKILLENHANVDHRDRTGECTPLIRAARKGNKEVVKLLLKRNANPNLQSSNGNSALMLAVNNGHVDIVEDLLWAGANTDLVNKVGGTAKTVALQKSCKGLNNFIINGYLNSSPTAVFEVMGAGSLEGEGKTRVIS